MSYSLFCADASTTASKKMPDLCRVIPVNSDLMGVAIEEACRLIADGVIVWKIKGSDGFTMERTDIETERLRRHAARINSGHA
jgi:coenzyme F420-reducing hydrogenase delta subunit